MERVFSSFSSDHRGGRRENKDSIQTYCRFKIQNLKPLELTEAEILKHDVSILSDHLAGLFWFQATMS